MRRDLLALFAACALLLAGTAWAREKDSSAPGFVPVVGVPRADEVVAPEPEPSPEPVQPVEPVDLSTSWGFGQKENLYNDTILEAVASAWPHAEIPLPPALFKSIVAAESSFNPGAVSATGAAGLVQLTPDTASRFGLKLAERAVPELAVPVGVQVLAEKARAVLDPANYHLLIGRRPEDCPYALKVARAYEEFGAPAEEEFWPLMLAAYNGGGGTVLRAMAIASERGLDPRVWENLVGDRSRPASTPLYAACAQVYGPRGAAGKYREMARYPEKVLGYYRTAQK